jgi:hypothetical protein
MAPAILVALLLQAGQPPAAEPAAPAPPGAAATPSAAPAAPPAPAAPAAQPAEPRQVWVFIDRWKEFGGTVMAETDQEITVYDGIETRTFVKTKIADVVDITRPRPGQQGMIQLRDGTIVRGEIVRDSIEEVEFRVNSIAGKLPRSQVYRVMLEPDFETRYAALKGDIAPQEHGRRLGLARWLVAQERMDLAISELEALLREADVEAARDMLRDINARIRLQRSVEESRKARPAANDGAAPPGSASPVPGSASTPGNATPIAPAMPPALPPGPPPEAPKRGPGPPKSADLLPKDLLTEADVNLIRVYEINFDDPPQLHVAPEGVRQLILRYGSSSLIPATAQERNALYTKPPLELARLLFDLRARDLYGHIAVEEDPAALALFRTRVHNSWLVPNCATSRCHGGVDAGRFFLYTGSAKDARIRYTNLMTLITLKFDGHPLVDFEDPPNSLVVQYAMPREMARYPHPDVRGWKPVLTDSTPMLMSDTLEWIRSMYRPRPEYPIQFVPPRLDAPDAPVVTPDGPDR